MSLIRSQSQTPMQTPNHQRKEAYVKCQISKTESRSLQLKERLMGSLKVGWPERASWAWSEATDALGVEGVAGHLPTSQESPCLHFSVSPLAPGEGSQSHYSSHTWGHSTCNTAHVPISTHICKLSSQSLHRGSVRQSANSGVSVQRKPLFPLVVQAKTGQNRLQVPWHS